MVLTWGAVQSLLDPWISYPCLILVARDHVLLRTYYLNPLFFFFFKKSFSLKQKTCHKNNIFLDTYFFFNMYLQCHPGVSAPFLQLSLKVTVNE